MKEGVEWAGEWGAYRWGDWREGEDWRSVYLPSELVGKVRDLQSLSLIHTEAMNGPKIIRPRRHTHHTPLLLLFSPTHITPTTTPTTTTPHLDGDGSKLEVSQHRPPVEDPAENVPPVFRLHKRSEKVRGAAGGEEEEEEGGHRTGEF